MAYRRIDVAVFRGDDVHDRGGRHLAHIVLEVSVRNGFEQYLQVERKRNETF